MQRCQNKVQGCVFCRASLAWIKPRLRVTLEEQCFINGRSGLCIDPACPYMLDITEDSLFLVTLKILVNPYFHEAQRCELTDMAERRGHVLLLLQRLFFSHLFFHPSVKQFFSFVTVWLCCTNAAPQLQWISSIFLCFCYLITQTWCGAALPNLMQQTWPNDHI